MNLSKLDAFITREADHGPCCGCGNGLHYAEDHDTGACADCRAAEAQVEAALDRDADEELAAVAAEIRAEREARQRTAGRVAA